MTLMSVAYVSMHARSPRLYSMSTSVSTAVASLFGSIGSKFVLMSSALISFPTLSSSSTWFLNSASSFSVSLSDSASFASRSTFDLFAFFFRRFLLRRRRRLLRHLLLVLSSPPSLPPSSSPLTIFLLHSLSRGQFTEVPL